MFCFVHSMVSKPGPPHGQVSPTMPGLKRNMPFPVGPSACSKNPDKLPKQRLAGFRNRTSHLPIRGSLVVAQYCAGKTAPETDWETWHLFGQGSPD